VNKHNGLNERNSRMQQFKIDHKMFSIFDIRKYWYIQRRQSRLNDKPHAHRYRQLFHSEKKTEHI
jgi:hypothetical protein